MTVYLLAHGSVDPRHAQDVQGIAGRLSAALDEQVRPCYLDLCPPRLAEVAEEPGTVVPLLFSPGYHMQVDVAEAVAAAAVPLTVAEAPLLTSGAPWASDLLRQTRDAWPGYEVLFVTAGSRDQAVLAQWDITATSLGVTVVHAGGPGARLADLPLQPSRVAVPLLVARGAFSDLIADQAGRRGVAVAALAGTSEALTAELARSVQRSRRRARNG